LRYRVAALALADVRRSRKIKVINRLNEKVIAEVVTNRRMTIEEVLELVGVLSAFSLGMDFSEEK
jgi:hypothetical protein